MGCAVQGRAALRIPEGLLAACAPKPLTLRLLMQVWGSASPMLKRVWSSSREHEVMEEWLDEVTLQNQAKMVLKGASAWPEKDLEHKTKHSREPQPCPHARTRAPDATATAPPPTARTLR
jgi:hypothetical protein